LAKYVPSFLKFRRGDVVEELHEIDRAGGGRQSAGQSLRRAWADIHQAGADSLHAARPAAGADYYGAGTLQDEVQPFPVEQARRLIEESTEMPLSEAFREFSDEPFASGSIGQVHRATTADGQQVVVKVKRPGIDQVVQLDIYVLKWMAERAEHFFPELRPYHPMIIVEEFAQTIHNELDFINEASATSRFHEAFKDDPKIFTPAVRWDLTGVNVLTLEYMDGLHLRDALGEKKNIPGAHGTCGCDHKALAHNLAECFLKQFFELGLFHADPHPGNLLFRPPDKLVLFDFGMIGQLDDELTGRLVIGIVAAVKREIDIVIEVLADLGCLGRNTDRTVLARDLGNLLNKYYGLPIRRLEVGDHSDGADRDRAAQRCDAARSFVAMFKALGTVSGVVLQLDPELICWSCAAAAQQAPARAFQSGADRAADGDLRVACCEHIYGTRRGCSAIRCGVSDAVSFRSTSATKTSIIWPVSWIDPATDSRFRPDRVDDHRQHDAAVDGDGGEDLLAGCRSAIWGSSAMR